LLDRFARKTLNFVKNNDTELMAMKNKVTRDLQS
jgi:hypothetical protein